MSFGTTDICLIAIALALWVMVLWGLDITT
jgi:hypothetical protein